MFLCRALPLLKLFLRGPEGRVNTLHAFIELYLFRLVPMVVLVSLYITQDLSKYCRNNKTVNQNNPHDLFYYEKRAFISLSFLSPSKRAALHKAGFRWLKGLLFGRNDSQIIVFRGRDDAGSNENVRTVRMRYFSFVFDRNCARQAR